MRELHRVRDTRLDSSVATKIFPAQLKKKSHEQNRPSAPPSAIRWRRHRGRRRDHHFVRRHRNGAAKGGIFPQLSEPQSFTASLLLLATAYRSIYGVVGSYLTASLAPYRPMG